MIRGNWPTTGGTLRRRSIENNSFRHKRFTNNENFGTVHLKHVNRDLPDEGPWDDLRSIPLKMIVPTVFSRIKEAMQFPGRINSRNVWAFEEIAVRTGPRQIRNDGWPSVFQRNDVFRVKRQRCEFFWKVAILAAPQSAGSEGFTQECVHSPFSLCGRFLR
jgi:hypothetical protein